MDPQAQAVVHVLDDDASVRRALTRMLDAAGWTVAPFASLGELLHCVDPDCAGCLLIDVRLPGLSGFEIRELLKSADIEMPVIFMTGFGELGMVVRAMRDGAVDFLIKPMDEHETLTAIGRAVAIDLSARRLAALRQSLQIRWSTLTLREREVCQLVVSGLLNKQVAGQLGTREKTIKVHRRRVMDKMGVGSLAELVRATYQLGVEPAQ
jgi:FixJ family two-component response regulator